jgi:hypothetical protein
MRNRHGELHGRVGRCADERLEIRSDDEGRGAGRCGVRRQKYRERSQRNERRS